MTFSPKAYSFGKLGCYINDSKLPSFKRLRIVNKSSATQTAYAIYRAVIQSYLTACVRLCRYVAKLSMNSTANGSSGSWSCFDQLNSTASKIGGTVTYCLIFIVSLAANSLIVMIVYKTPNLRKPINYFIANLASSDLLFPIFFIPWNLSRLHTTSLLIGGPLGQAFCKLVPFFGDVSIGVSIQNLILIAVDRFGAVVFPLRSPLIRSKLCPFFILATWVIAVAVKARYLFANELVESPERNWCVTKWKKVIGESSSRASFQLAYYIFSILFTAISRKVVGKSPRDNPERCCGWFLIHCFSKKFERMTREAMDVCLRVLKESNKSRFDNYSVRNCVLIISHITFRDCHVHIFSDKLSRNSCIDRMQKWLPDKYSFV